MGRMLLLFHPRLVLHTLALVFLISAANASLLVALIIQPFSEQASWDLACFTAEWFWGYMQRHWEDDLHAGAALTFSGDEIPAGESAVVISNHLGYSDYYLIQSLARRAGMLGGCRYFVKKELVWQIPIFGWAFWAIGMILVSRDWTRDASTIENAFGRVKENEHAVWIISYPEGTRRTPQKIWKAQAFARENRKTPLRLVLYPRTKGFAATIQEHSHVRHVYDLTLLYTSPPPDVNRAPTLADQLGCADLAAAGYGFHVHVRRFSMKELPSDEAGLREWCEDVWTDKDRMLRGMVESSMIGRGGEVVIEKM